MTRQALSVLLSLCFAPSLAAQAPSEVEVILRPGQPLGLDSSFFRSTRALARNAAGHMVFLASYCRQAPPEIGPCQADENVFLSDDQGIRPLIDEATRPPGFSLANVSSTLFLTDSGRVLLARPDGVLRFEGDRFRWLARQGDRAPGVSFQGTELYFQQFRVTGRFARENGNVVFSATLTDQSNGVFETDGETVVRILSEGEVPPGGAQPIPAGALLPARPKAAGALTAFLSAPQDRGTGLFLYDGTTLRAIATRGQALDGVTVDDIEGFDLNAAGQLAFVVRYQKTPQVRDARLFMYQNGQIVPLTSMRPPAGLLDIPVNSFTGPWVTDSGEVFFGIVQVSNTGGIFCWRAGRVTKIVADGDAGPGGSTLTVSIGPEIDFPNLPIVSFAVQVIALPRAPGVLAFQAVTGNSTRLSTLVWRSGSLEIVDLNDRLLPGQETRLVEQTRPIDVDASGRVLILAGLCCGAPREAVLLTGGALGSRQYIPYLAEGVFSPEIFFQSQLRSSNASPYPGLYESAVIREAAAPGAFPPSLWLRALGGGLAEELNFYEGPGAGFLRLDTLQGGPLGFYGVIQLVRHGVLASQTTVEAQTPMRDARLVIDSAASERIGVAVSNPGMDPLAIDWDLLDDSGQSVAEGVIELPASGQSAQFVDELAAGVGQPFLGALRLRSQQPFLAAGLRLNGLRLSTIPVESAARPASPYGFELLVANRPDLAFDDQPSQLLLGPDDEQAWVTQDGRLRLATREGVRTLFGPGQPLPEATFAATYPSRVALVEFGPAGLLFALTPTIGQPGLFLWHGGQARRLVRDGDSTPGGVRVGLGEFAEEFAINDSGEIALGGSGLFLRRSDGSLTPIFLGDDPAPGGETFGRIVSVDINESGAVGFATERVVGWADAAGPRVVARIGEPFGDGFFADGFESVRITSDGHLYFTATGLERLPHSSPTPVSGLFFFDGQAVRAMLRTGSPVTPGSQVLVGQVARLSYPSSLPSRIKLNRRDQLAAFASLQLGGSPSLGGFFLLDNTTARPRLLAPDARVDPQSSLRIFPAFNGFGWNDRSELLFRAYHSDFEDGVFRLRADGGLEIILGEGDRVDDPNDSEPEAARFFFRVWDLSNSGTAAFEVHTFPNRFGATYLARPSGFQRLWVPQVASGDFGGLVFSSSLLIHNSSRIEARVEVDVFSAAGVREFEFPEIALGPEQTSRLNLEFPRPMAGYARLRVRGAGVTAFLRMSLRDGDGPLSELTVPAVGAGREAVWRAGAFSGQNRNTGLAVVNTGQAETEISVQRLTVGGIAVDVRRFSLPPQGYRAILLTELYPEQIYANDGVYRISSSNLIALFSLEQLQGRLTGVPIARGRGMR